MKTRISLLAILLIFLVSCSDKESVRKYSSLRNYYMVLTPLLDFVIEDQQAVLEENGLATNFEVNPPTYRKATEEDRSTAYKVGMTTITIRGWVSDIMIDCEKIIALASKKIVSRADKEMIKLYSEYIEIKEKGILELTEGKTAKEYVYPYVPIPMRRVEE